MRTVWVLGDQLNRQLGPLGAATPDDARVLLVHSGAKAASKRWHRQRLHLVRAGMARLANELRAEGFTVDERNAPTLTTGLAQHRHEHHPDEVVAMEPASWDGRELLRRLDVHLEPTTQFLCHPDDFADWAGDRRTLRMEDFYRWQRRRLRILMDGDEPAGGRWNYDDENRQPPPGDGRKWPAPLRSELDDVDRQILDELPAQSWGAEPDGVWATTRTDALRRLRHVVDEVLPVFGPHEDAMLSSNWHLAHTLLSPYLNLGMLQPAEVVDAAEAAYRDGRVPIASAEGFIRQIIGWREYVWGLYWLWMPDYRHRNDLDAQRPLPPLYTGAPTAMRCVASVLGDVHDHAWTHHIARLMVLGNLALLAGVRPAELTEWMWASFVDGAEWVMLPNVVGMALYADGGQMATKPYAAGGNYINRMSDFCGDCAFDRTARTGDDACPFTTLYWAFIDHHRDLLATNNRTVRQVRAADRLGNLDEVRTRAAEVLELLDRGEL
ncbi:MAG: cryptochrome/photolyase family protein [Acidimicrobiia bacterium]|nr:cryptochrome/photolyase family protein [Acidimicrobiia bacterium]